MKDAVAAMGDVLPDETGGRDAVHVAVFSATCEQRLSPCQPVVLVSQGSPDCVVGSTAHTMGEIVGIVDPFLLKAVRPGQRFWVFLMPRTITGLSHQWTHPAFEETSGAYTPSSDKLASEQWLKDFIRNADCPDYHTVMGMAERIADGSNPAWDDEYMHFTGQDAHGEIPDEFWHHAEVVLGRSIKTRPKYFSCGC